MVGGPATFHQHHQHQIFALFASLCYTYNLRMFKITIIRTICKIRYIYTFLIGPLKVSQHPPIISMYEQEP